MKDAGENRSRNSLPAPHTAQESLPCGHEGREPEGSDRRGACEGPWGKVLGLTSTTEPGRQESKSQSALWGPKGGRPVPLLLVACLRSGEAESGVDQGAHGTFKQTHWHRPSNISTLCGRTSSSFRVPNRNMESTGGVLVDNSQEVLSEG